VAETDHVYYEVPGMEKDRALVRIIEIENPDSGLIFCNTRANTAFVAKVLQRFGYDADQLSADLPQKERDKVLERVHQGKLRFLVATDVAARGLDIANLSHVVLYDFPEDHESYIHRAGRTGRAGAAGTAISLVDVLERMELKAVAAQYGIDMQKRELPTDEDVQSVVAERVTAQLETKLRTLDKLVRERMERMIPLARRLGETDDELAVIAMLIDEFYQKTLHAVPEVPREGERPASRETDGGESGGNARGERSPRRSGGSGGGRSRDGRSRSGRDRGRSRGR
jgi:ATP-dependent RNA helicase DeaD